MSARIVAGHEVAAAVIAATRTRADQVAGRLGRRPRLVNLFSGEDAGVRGYLDRQRASAGLAGIDWSATPLPSSASTTEACALVTQLSSDAAVDGIAILFPLPPTIDVAALLSALAPGKDVDGLHPANAGALACGHEGAGFVPCTALGAVALAESLVGPLRGRRITVVGASIRVGRPLLQLLLNREATVTVAHAATQDLAGACRDSELLFVAAGRAGLITAAAIRPDAVVIDIGINVVPAGESGNGSARIVGDVDLGRARDVARVISSVPDGVGPVTTAYLMSNTVLAAEARLAGPMLQRLDDPAAPGDRRTLASCEPHPYSRLGQGLA
jgi:methylenetetrahydrofolate dehydrogenase (NADP+)/methenyltetrahydrofolate cyclohydrolase